MSLEQVRPVVDCFCQILSLYGFSTITSEVFHWAKFDRNEATIPLWRLIFEMIHFDSQKFSKTKFDQKPKSEIVDIIKRDLYERGYTYDQFLLLDNKMQKGSRQLLVCVGWLIYHINLIEKCMKQCLNSISSADQNDEDQYVKYDLIKQIKQAIHSNIKIRSRLQAIERINLHENRHMSSFEIQLCQYPHLIFPYLTELNLEYRKLNLFIYWDKYENIFWKWMESVLDQPISVDNSETDCQNLEAEKEKFNAAIDTLDGVLIRLEQLWLSNDDHASIERDMSVIIASIDTQISSLFNKLLNPNRLSIINSE